MGIIHSCTSDKTADLNKIKNFVANMKAKSVSMVLIILILAAVFIFWYRIPKVPLMDKIKESIKNEYYNHDPFGIVNVESQLEDHSIRDFYVASSYNSCRANGSYKNMVSIYPMINALEKGARLLDFEVYSHKEKAVISASDNPSYKIKGTYNILTLNEVFNAVNNHAFSSVSNTGDPLFLNFRIKSSKSKVLDDLIASLPILGPRLLSTSNPEYGGILKMGDLITQPLKTIKGKIVIIINIPEPAGEYCNGCRGDSGNPSYGNELINFSDKSPFQFNYRFESIKNKHNIDLFIDQNKKNVSIVYPNLSDSINNENWRIPFQYGCQFVLMNYQTRDANLNDYHKKFSTSSFMLKPEELRDSPSNVTDEHLEDPEQSYGPKNVTSEQPLVQNILDNIGGTGESAQI